MKRAKILQKWVIIVALLTLGLGLFNSVLSQTQRNPVLEFCTGTW